MNRAISHDERAIDPVRMTRAVVWSQMLFTAGNSLTIGGFLNYFVNEFDPAMLFVAAIQITPESAEAFSYSTRQVLRVVHSRKWLWIAGLVMARLIALLIPCSMFFTENSSSALTIILVSLAGWHLLQGVSYCSYISWLSELVPERNWGAFFAKRKMASLLVAIVVPTSAGLLRKYWLGPLDDDWQLRSYVVIFVAGALLAISAVLPLLRFPDRPFFEPQRDRTINLSQRRDLSRMFRWLLTSRWWLSFFQGLTQGLLVTYSIRVLKIGLEEYYVLSGIMLLLQMGASYYAGKLCDRNLEVQVLIWSLIGVSFAMWFWWGATPETKWLAAGAYVLWGGFGFVNMALHNLTLKLAPRDDNAREISLSRLGSGAVAGFAGLVGGFCFDQMKLWPDWSELAVYQTLFLISWGGRFTAALWLIPIGQSAVASDAKSDSRNSTISPTRTVPL